MQQLRNTETQTGQAACYLNSGPFRHNAVIILSHYSGGPPQSPRLYLHYRSSWKVRLSASSIAGRYFLCSEHCEARNS